MAASSSALQVGSREHTVKWFDETVAVPPQARELLENYSRIPAAEVQDHVITLVSIAVFFFSGAGQRAVRLTVTRSATKPGKSGHTHA